MKFIALLSVLPLAALSAAAPSSWSLLDKQDVSSLEANREFSLIQMVIQVADQRDYPRCLQTAGMVIPIVDALAKQQSAGLAEFQNMDHPTPEMDAAALVLWLGGDACFQMGDLVTAKAMFEKVWRQYPFARVRFEESGAWMPGKDAYSEWLTIGWMEAIRGKGVSKYPFDPSLSIFHSAQGAKGLRRITPLRSAARKVFDADGPKPLEAAMAQMLSSDSYKNPDSSDQILNLVGGLAEPAHEDKENEWQDLQARLEKWAHDDPKSSLAKLVLARFWIEYAWHARGDGLGATVTADGWRFFGERLHKALDVQRQMLVENPVWYANGLTLGMALGADADQEAAMFEEGMEKFPWSVPIYESMLVYLLPRWHGQPGDWQKFALHVAKKAGPELYLEIVDSARDGYAEPDVAHDSLVDWRLMWQGYESKLKHASSPWPTANKYAQEACQRGDKQAAQAAFSHAEARFHPLYWKNRADYEWWRQWAAQP